MPRILCRVWSKAFRVMTLKKDWLPAPDPSTVRYAQRMDEMARYRARLERQV